MKVAEKATPVAAVFAALATLACCMPLGLLGAVGLAWILLIIGAVQIYRGRRSCRTKSRGSVITFWVALALVLFIFLFPQVIANVLAGLS